ncbi:hypothetical protein ZIOFF_044416 [Zingiber officinale]|uniref:Cytochrome P450 n=1 Tax=Zingiber officinale TaxID=94328 RepID=A0A8J5G673_ZINOF|nr:hypothetical protein ZIOFF_044416 [Zingiber officinale]
MDATALGHLPTVIHGGFQRLLSFSATHSPHSIPSFNSRFAKSSSSIRCQSSSMEKSKTSKKNLLDNASNLLTNLLSGGRLGSLPTAEGAVSDLFGRPLFFRSVIGFSRKHAAVLTRFILFKQHGSVYKLAFGPKSFVVVSDPIVARHVLRENAYSYDKGVLAEILEPIMGKGLIPADLGTWKQRRKDLIFCGWLKEVKMGGVRQDAVGIVLNLAVNVIAPGFHSLFLEAMVKVFTDCSERSISKFEKLLESENSEIEEIQFDLEAEFSNLALDIIGLGIFNYDFGSVTKESPVIKAVYGTLFEAEHRSTFYIPYWNLPFVRWIVPRQIKFHNDLKIINDCFDGLIKNAKETRHVVVYHSWKMILRYFSKEITHLSRFVHHILSLLHDDVSLLRFLVDMRGVDVDDRQLRDDLMTMFIAGHETTTAVLTWSVFLLAQVQYLRLIIVEALRLYPQPPLLIRRALKEDKLLGGYMGNEDGYAIPAGTYFYFCESPYFWDKPDEFAPERFLTPKANEGIAGWAGYDPSRSPGAMYPNEITSGFAFIPFGGGPHKCVGDQFALLESTVALALLLQKFDVQLRGSPDEVQLITGAIIHTKSGLWCKLRSRASVGAKQNQLVEV